MPSDFPALASTMYRYELKRHYRTNQYAIHRWLSESGTKSKSTARPLTDRRRLSAPLRDDLFGILHRHVPMTFAPDVRADMISDLYVAVLDGSLSLERLKVDGGSILNKTGRMCGIWSTADTVSIDVGYGTENESWADRIADPATLIAFEDREQQS